MKQRLQKFFEGRQGMDELSKALFWGGLAALLLSGLCIKLLNGALSTVLSWLGLAAVIFCFVRAFRGGWLNARPRTTRSSPCVPSASASGKRGRIASASARITSFSSAPAAAQYCACPAARERYISAANAGIFYTGKREFVNRGGVQPSRFYPPTNNDTPDAAAQHLGFAINYSIPLRIYYPAYS